MNLAPHRHVPGMRRWFQSQRRHPGNSCQQCRLWKAAFQQSGGYRLIWIRSTRQGTYVVDQSEAFDTHVFSIKRILEKFDDIVANGVLGRESLGPCQNFPRTKGSLLDGEGKGETKVDDVWDILRACAARRRVRGSSTSGQESIHRVREIIWRVRQLWLIAGI